MNYTAHSVYWVYYDQNFKKSGFGETAAQISQAEIKAAHQVNSTWGNKFWVQVLDMLKYVSWQEAAVTVRHHSTQLND